MKIKLPYGISNFEQLVENGYVYIDRTNYIELLENLTDRFILFIRPRRFGKSLFVSVLDYYYNIKYKDKFEKLFSKYYIGKNPTPLKNSYLVLRFNFSGINTETKESTYNGFLDKVKVSVKSFLNMYENILKINHEDKNQILENKTPESIIDNLFELVKTKTEKKIYILIDEYDHFANELISFNLTDFYKIVTQNGFVRKFYETIKIGTKSVVDRIFITGVTPITLDSLTSGFNIKKNLSTDIRLNSMLGFKHEEVYNLIKDVISECPELNADEIFNEMIDNYDGYLFHKNAKDRIFNSDMVLYYLSEIINCKKPRKLLDSNIASDYNKI
ncbi:MAG TPA: AAA family ATPase, partial [bacterium]|nr:AAA family ATPase [bacterium]